VIGVTTPLIAANASGLHRRVDVYDLAGHAVEAAQAAPRSSGAGRR